MPRRQALIATPFPSFRTVSHRRSYHDHSALEARSCELRYGPLESDLTLRISLESDHGRFLRHRFSPKAKKRRNRNQFTKKNHVAKEAVSTAWQTNPRQRSERTWQTERCSSDEAVALRKHHVVRLYARSACCDTMCQHKGDCSDREKQDSPTDGHSPTGYVKVKSFSVGPSQVLGLGHGTPSPSRHRKQNPQTMPEQDRTHPESLSSNQPWSPRALRGAAYISNVRNGFNQEVSH